MRVQAKVIKKPSLKKEEKKGMTPYEEALHERLLQAKGYIDEVEHLNEDFEENIAGITSELNDMSRERTGKNPGYYIKKMMSKWADEPVHTQD